MINLTNISKTFGSGENLIKAVDNINLKINKGEFVAIIGPSGCGKSTLLNIIGCLSTATSGEYILDNEKIEGLDDKKLSKVRREKIGFIFQNFALVSNQSTLYNILLPLKYSSLSKTEKNERALSLLNKFQLLSIKDKNVNELSGGQKQRVAIIRALINNPSILLADEPTGALDRKNSENILDIFETLNKEGQTIIMVTHDNYLASKTNRIIEMLDGKIINE